MKFIKTEIEGLTIIEPTVFGDERGYFLESYNQKKFEESIGQFSFVQDNESKSSKGVLRGLHFQLAPHAQSKLVSVVKGEILDIAVDLRRGSPSFARHLAVKLSHNNKKQVFIPRGFAHGFVVLSDTATIAYKVDNYYSPEHDCGLAFDDVDLNIDWQLSKQQLRLSDKDTKLPTFIELKECFDYNNNYYE